MTINLNKEELVRTTPTFTHTEEGKQVLEMVGYVISTAGMEVYKCERCEELFAGQPELVEDEDENPMCGICQDEHWAMIKAICSNEHEYDPELDD